MLPADLITPKEAARLIRTHISTIHRWVQSGRLRGWKRGSRYLISRADVEAMLRPVTPLPELTREKELEKRAEKAMEELRRDGWKV